MLNLYARHNMGIMNNVEADNTICDSLTADE